MVNFSRGALFLALGIALAGWWVGQGFQKGRAADRYVTVKGISEREVKADVAVWVLRFVASDNDLARAQAKIESNQKTVLEFLAKHGVPAEATEIQGLEVNDLLANPYRNGPITNRFIINQGVLARSAQPESIQALSQKVGELVDAGVVLTAGGGPGAGPTYLFTRLNDLKPEMIAEATASARAAAQQFAKDSKSRLGGIRQANQGVFVILPRDQSPGTMEESRLNKTVRVVTTVEYYLKD
jgi:hypothetical protein